MDRYLPRARTLDNAEYNFAVIGVHGAAVNRNGPTGAPCVALQQLVARLVKVAEIERDGLPFYEIPDLRPENPMACVCVSSQRYDDAEA